MTPGGLMAQISSTIRLGPVCLVVGRHKGRCCCLLGVRCDRPGEHTMSGRYWLATSRSPREIAAQYLHHQAVHDAPCGLAVLLHAAQAVLQVPSSLTPDLVDYLDDRGLTPPTVHGPRCSWVWITAPPDLHLRRRVTLPHQHTMAAIGPGGWVPVPPTTLGTDTMPLTWGYPPTGESLTPQRATALHRYLLLAAGQRDPVAPLLGGGHV